MNVNLIPNTNGTNVNLQPNITGANVNISKGATQSDLFNAVNNAKLYRDESESFSMVSENKSIESTNSALNASISATTAGDKATIATTKAAEASNSASSASASETVCIAKATIATDKADIATAQAVISTDKASEASTSASTATTQAGIATTKAAEAVISANSAAGSASVATTKANDASLSASSALASENKAEKWATENEDIEVEVGEYSAKHWALKAQEFAEGNATNIGYDNTSSGLVSTNVQAAIDEIVVNTAGIHDAANITTGTLSDDRLPDTISSNITGNAATATKWSSSRTITLSGDVAGSVSIDGSADVTLTTTVAANSVTLGTDTTGNYVAGVTQGTGISVTGTAGEGWSPTVSLTNVGMAGTYRSITTDAQGRVISGTNPTTVAGYELTDVYTKTEVDDALDAQIALKTIATGTATFTATTNNINLTGIGIGVEIGDVIQISGANDAKNNSEFTVEVITDSNNIIVNQAHAGKGTGKNVANSASDTGVTVKLLSKWYNAPIGLGQGWVDVASSRSANVTYTSGRPIMVSITVNNGSVSSNLEVNGLEIGRCDTSSDSIKISINAIVSNASTYKFTGIFLAWSELR